MKKFILILIAIVIYLAIGINQAKFQNEALNKHPEQRSSVEKVITLYYLSSSNEELKAKDIERFEQRQEEAVSFKDLSFFSMSLEVIFIWWLRYVMVAFAYALIYFIVGLLYLKWIILAIVAMALYSNFGYWLGGYVYDKSTTTPNLLTKFLTINNSEYFLFNWETAVNNENPTKGKVQTIYAFLWPLFLIYVVFIWSLLALYRLLELIYKVIKGILWLMFAGPARDGWKKD